MSLSRLLAAAAAAAVLAPPAVSSGQAPAPLVLEQPIACRLGETCFIQQYFDHDPGPGAKDYRCGPRVYDGHDGLDVRLPSMVEMRRGVAVLAAGPGAVRSIRDGMADDGRPDSSDIAGRECGNGVVIAHAGGWETQYCHLARGSVRVRQGQAVAAGDVLGDVGLSGETEFPHLHFALRQGKARIDPFGPRSRQGAGKSDCGQGSAMWSPAASAALAYRDSEVINMGFATGPVSPQAVESGEAAASRPSRQSETLVFFVRVIGLRSGDRQSLVLKGPDGAVLANSAPAPLDADKAQWTGYAGRRADGPWPAGRYVGEYSVRRGDAEALRRTVTLDL